MRRSRPSRQYSTPVPLPLRFETSSRMKRRSPPRGVMTFRTIEAAAARRDAMSRLDSLPQSRGVQGLASGGTQGTSRGPRIGETGGTLVAQDLHGDLALPGTVELGKDHGLEAAQRELAVDDGDRDVAAEQRRAQMRVRVAALAVGVARIVVTVATPLGDETLDEALEIVDERALELVDEQRARRMERIDEGDTVLDGKLLNRLTDELGDVVYLGTLLRRQREAGVEDLHVGALSGRP